MDISIVDFHAHVLPKADHGSSSLEVSLEQLKLASKHGVRHVIATPHFYPDRHDVASFLQMRSNSFDGLRCALNGDLPRVSLGAEVLMCDGLERLEGIERLCIEGTDILLLELPFSVYKPEYRDSVSRLLKRGLRVVLAHVDRYTPSSVEAIADVGALMQLNAHALSSFGIRSHIKSWLASGAVVALGSDIHGVDKNAYKRFAKARERLVKLGAEKGAVALSNELDHI